MNSVYVPVSVYILHIFIYYIYIIYCWQEYRTIQNRLAVPQKANYRLSYDPLWVYTPKE